MIETISYLFGFATLGAFLYFMWMDTQPNNIKIEKKS